MMSLDAGVKYHGLSLEGEYYRRWLSDFTGPNTAGIAAITDSGYQLQSSAMIVQKVLQVYLSGAQIFGRFGDASELRAGGNWYFTKQRGLRVNAEFIQLNNSSRRVHSRAVPGRRQRAALQHQPRDELLIPTILRCEESCAQGR